MIMISRKTPEQALGGLPLGLRLVTKINLLNFHALKWSTTGYQYSYSHSLTSDFFLTHP